MNIGVDNYLNESGDDSDKTMVTFSGNSNATINDINTKTVGDFGNPGKKLKSIFGILILIISLSREILVLKQILLVTFKYFYMKQTIRIVPIALMLFFLQSCLTEKKTQKLIVDALVALNGIDKICFSQPLLLKPFDPNKPNEIEVQVTLSNGSNYDVVSYGQLSIEILIWNKNGNIIAGTNQPYLIPNPTNFPKNQANAYTSPPIIIASGVPFKKGEKYIIEARKWVIGPSYSSSNIPPFNSSCYLYKYPVTLE